MSGFFGMLRTDGTAVEPRFVEEVAQRLRFRGPDGGQTWAKDGLGRASRTWRPGRATNPAGSQQMRTAQRGSWSGRQRVGCPQQAICRRRCTGERCSG